MKEKLPLSVSIISFNEEGNIERLLKSVVEFATEIVVVDSHSTDRTREIAESYGARVFEEDWKGHIDQKNSALEKCTQEWILSLDCDEEVSPELEASVHRAISEGRYDGYKINRRTHYLGQFLKHAWYPDRKLRLVKRSSKPHWAGYNPHDVLFVEGEVGSVSGDMYHYSYKGVEHHFVSTVGYARLSAQSYAEKGKQFRLHKLLLNPPFAFFKRYIIQKGFLDGQRGLVVAFSTFLNVFLKYLFLWEINFKKQDKKE